MVTQYRCGTQRRREAVRGATSLNGIDYLEVGPDQTTLEVHFLHNLPGTPADPVPAGPALDRTNVVVEGGVRVRDVQVVLVDSTADVLTVTVDRAGDFSAYTLRIRTSEEDQDPPSGFDPQLSQVTFSFKVGCPSDFDCRAQAACPPEELEEPEIDYMAKDYSSFRRLMLDRMAAIMPDWRERNPADVLVALVELLAYVGDHLSYFQDAVATEPYLGTARRRRSLRRHARLLDYFMHDGCNARAWVWLEVEAGSDWDGRILEAETPVLSAGSEGRTMIDPLDLASLIALERPTVFETMHPVTLREAHNQIRFHTWSDTGCCLPTGATRATLRKNPGLDLAPGDLLMFEEVKGPRTGAEADAEREHRHVVRLTRVVSVDRDGDPLTDPVEGTEVVEIEWDREDALPVPLCISVVSEEGTEVTEDVSVARGNVALVDHGLTVVPEVETPDPVPGQVPTDGPYRPHLARAPLTFREPLDPSEPAARAMERDPRAALPAVTLEGDGSSWTPRYDLLSSDRFAPEFVVETESAGTAILRFGDGFRGRRPTAGATFTATYRIGTGLAGNVGAEVLTRVVAPGSGITTVRNPLPASGGADPEPMERVRLMAPHALRTQQRAVVERDYAEVAERRRDIQRSAGAFRWTGSWYTAFVTVDRAGGLEVDPVFEDDLLRYLDVFRMAGYDLEINGPTPVPLDILLEVCVRPGYRRSDLQRSLLEAFGRGTLPGGRRAFFHPDRLTFGQPVYLSQMYRAALDIEGVAWVDARRFHRWGKAPNQELENGVLVPGPKEVVRLDNDPNFPENGRLELQMTGGL